MRHVRILKTLAVAATCVALALGPAESAWATSKVTLSPYAPFPKAASTAVGAHFARPTHAEVANVRVSVARAYAVGLTQVGALPKGARVTVRLGLFSDAVQGERVGVISYAVIFDGVTVPSYGPIAEPSDHELIVIVDATTGRSVEAFSYR
jgi:hypothetical protein